MSSTYGSMNGNPYSKSNISDFPVTFTPTDAAHLSKSFLDTDDDDSVIDEKQPLISKRSTRQPLMHPQWYSASPNTNGGLGFSPGLPNGVNNQSYQRIVPANLSHNDLHYLSATSNRQKYYNKLVHHSDERMRVPDHVLPSSLFNIIPTKETERQNSIFSIFSIWNTMMGTSLLTMPWGLEQAGFTLGVFLIIFMGALTFYTAYRVLISKNFLDHEIFEFSDVCKHYLGSVGEWLAVVFALITFLGGMVVYWVLMSNFLYGGGIFIYDSITHRHPQVNTSNIVLCPTGFPIPSGNSSHKKFDWVLHDDKDGQPGREHHRLWSSDLTVPLYLAILLLPLLNFKSPTFFTKFNSLGTLSVVFILSFVITKASIWGWNYEFTWNHDPRGFQFPDFKSTFTALTGLLSLAFFLHNAVITILKNNKHQENNVRDLSLGYLLVALTYLTVGVSFYVSFPLPKGCIASNLLDNVPASDVFASVARLLLLFQMMTVYPLLAYMFRVNALYALCKSAWPGLCQVLFVNICLVASCVLVAIFYPRIGDLIRYSGALCGMVYIFILPSLVHMLTMKSLNKLTPLSVFFHSLIMLFGVINFITQFIIKPST